MPRNIQQRLAHVEAKLEGVAEGAVTESVFGSLCEDLQAIEAYAREANLPEIAGAIHKILLLLEKARTTGAATLRDKAAELGVRVLATLREHFEDGHRVAFSTAEVVEPEPSTEEFMKSFLADSDGLFARLAEYAMRTSELSREDIQEIFRIVHTIKGNSVALAIEALIPYASKFEEILSNVLSGTIGLNVRTQEILKKGCAGMQEHLRAAQPKSVGAPAPVVTVESAPSPTPQSQLSVEPEGYVVYRLDGQTHRRAAEKIDYLLVQPKLRELAGGRLAVLVGMDWIEVRSAGDAKRWGIVFRDAQGRALDFADEIVTIDRGPPESNPSNS